MRHIVTVTEVHVLEDIQSVQILIGGFMFQIIKKRKMVTVTSYRIEFYKRIDGTDDYDDTWGFSFPCDEKGIIKDFECDAARKNYENVSADPEFVRALKKYEHQYTEPAVAKCRCGNTFSVTDRFYGCCECEECGQWYTLSGQEVLPPVEQMELADW